jgi:hypothetical protein
VNFAWLHGVFGGPVNTGVKSGKSMTDTEPIMVNCGPHGYRVAAVICCHLVGQDCPPAGFIENSSDPTDLQAWCYACEDKFEQEDGLTDCFREFNDLSVVCVACYAEAKARHSLPGN